MDHLSVVINAVSVIVGTVAGILASNKLTTYRIEQLEKKVDEYNDTVKKTLILEEQVKEVRGQVNTLQHRIEVLLAHADDED